MPDSVWFLLRGNPTQPEAQQEFVAAGGADARLALLLVRREGWECYLSRYVGHWSILR